MKTLYAIAFNVLDFKTGKLLKSDFEYLHAKNELEAKNSFLYANNPWGIVNGWVKNVKGVTYEIIGAAPVVGYIVEDEHGERLRA